MSSTEECASNRRSGVSVALTLSGASVAKPGCGCGPIGAGGGLAVLRRHLLGPLRGRGAPRAHCTERMRHAPDRVLVGHQHMVVPPREAIRAIKILDVATDPRCLAVALFAQERQVA